MTKGRLSRDANIKHLRVVAADCIQTHAAWSTRDRSVWQLPRTLVKRQDGAASSGLLCKLSRCWEKQRQERGPVVGLWLGGGWDRGVLYSLSLYIYIVIGSP